MRVVILGGTGFIGSALVKALLRAGHDVTVSSRRVRPQEGGGPAYARWDGQSPQALAEICKGAAAVVNLLGENIGAGRWTVARREAIIQSRVRAGEAVSAAFALLDKAGDALPKTLIQASASGWYGLWPDLATAPDCTEDAPAGSGFLAEVVRRWEASSAPVEALGVRRVRIRTAPVLGKGGGVLARMLPLYRWGLGGPAGTGRQPFPWIHLDDEAGAIVFYWSIRRSAAPAISARRSRPTRRALPALWAGCCIARRSCGCPPLSCGWPWDKWPRNCCSTASATRRASCWKRAMSSAIPIWTERWRPACKRLALSRI